jgi:hypothetical protein
MKNLSRINSPQRVESSLIEFYVTTDGKSASLSWNKAPIWGLWLHFCYCQTVAGLLVWGALSEERMGLSFTTAAGPRQRSHSRVPRDSRPYFTVSDSRLPFSSPPTTRRVTVDVFDPRLSVLTCPLFITSGEPNRGHHFEQLVVILLLFVFYPSLRNVPTCY